MITYSYISHQIKRISLFMLCISCISIGCKKFVDVQGPVTSINSDNVYANDATAISVLTGIYTKMSAGTIQGGGFASLSLFAGLSADEFLLDQNLASSDLIPYYTNTLTSTNTGFMDYWNNIYPIVYITNAAIEGITSSNSLSPKVKTQLLGEARFMRAFCYFYLENLYGDVPLALSTDYAVVAKMSRTSKSEVWAQIIEDLKEAQTLLANDYLDITLLKQGSERVRPNKWVATALLARTYLYNNKFVDAEKESSTLITNTQLYDTVSLDNVFLKNSAEAIWQLYPTSSEINTSDGRFFILPTEGLNFDHPVHLSDSLLKNFSPGDKRLTHWVGQVSIGSTKYSYPYKYKVNTLNMPITEYLMVFRLAEQYLIRAEARAAQNKINDAESDLNVIRKRAGLTDLNNMSQSALLKAIQHERRSELFSEWGHRWFDLKRSGTVDEVMSKAAPFKESAWQSYRQLFPIPLYDIQRAPNLSQNQGYQ
jgi:hypothetical protein